MTSFLAGCVAGVVEVDDGTEEVSEEDFFLRLFLRSGRSFLGGRKFLRSSVLLEGLEGDAGGF